MTREELQLAWDRCLIDAWRRFGTVGDATVAWHHLTGLKLSELDPPLRRVPATGMPWKVGVRVFVANFLPKINDRLWAQARDRDEALVAKLQTSTYDTLRSAIRGNDTRDLTNLGRQTDTNMARLQGARVLKQQREKDGDWATTKANVRRRRV